jgi:thioredoxin reductase (NADPH)
MTAEKTDLEIAIIGAGPAGLTAALYAARAMRKTALFERLAVGGQISTTHIVENYPGFVEGVSGPDLSFAMLDQAKRFGLEHRQDGVNSLRHEDGHFVLDTDGGPVTARAVILCTGARHRMLGLPKEKEFLMGRGLSVCATCDGAFFRDKEVVVVGGGDSALDEGLFLTKYCKRVTVVHRRDALRASKILQDRAFAEPKMEFVWDTVVTAILGEDKVQGARLKNLKTGQERELPCEGLFVFIGHLPNSDLVKDLVDRDDQGYITVNPLTMETRTPGLFAAGDLRIGAFRQAITAAGDGCAAAMMADRWLSEQSG